MNGKEFKRIRERLDLERSELAEVFGMSGYMAIANIENGSRNPGPILGVLMKTLDAVPLKRAKEIIELLRKFGHGS
ncbi:MAG: helix-turn-helix domain-containing protein [Pseudomonadota bacterium]|nr:helix-turn-helix domain-containing protein [Pseudomonadota bacterium]